MDKNSRSASIDAFRGFAVIGMVLVNYGLGISWIPAILKHAPDVGLTIADFIAPFFIFAIALNYGQSFDRRMQKDGFPKTAGHFAGRYLAIAGIGAVFTAGAPLTGLSPNWGVLQAIGMAGLAGILFIRLKPYVRLAAGFALLLVYQLILDAFMLRTTLNSVQGGLFGSISWSAMLILSTVLADIFRQSKKRYLLLSILLLALGAASALLFPVSKNRVSLSYVLITVAVGALLFLLFDAVFENGRRPGFLAWWGANPLLLYILSQILLGFYVIPGIQWWYSDVYAPLAAAQAALMLAVLTLTACALYRRSIFIKL